MMGGPDTAGQAGRGGRPRGRTRERILDVALVLFNEQGYDKTSLREIAGRLGFTKAALYYHFAHKEEILLALHLRLHALGREILDDLAGLDDPTQAVKVWPRLLDDMITAVVENRPLFVLHHRNRSALEQLEHSDLHAAEHDDLQSRLSRVLADPAIPLRDRIRLGVALAAVIGTMITGPEAFDADLVEVADGLRAAVQDLLD
jgi:AcrR family transcriptional regulator